MEQNSSRRSGSFFWCAVLFVLSALSFSIAIDPAAETSTRLSCLLLSIWAFLGSTLCAFPNTIERLWAAIGLSVSLGQTLCGVALAGLAAMWLYSAYNPSGDDNPYLFAFLYLFAAIASGFCLFPKSSVRIWKTIGIGVDWIFRIVLAFALVGAVISIIVGQPIAAAIIFGALIIANAVRQLEDS